VVYFELVAVYDTVVVALEALAAELNARVESGVYLEFEFEYEIAVVLIGAEECVWRAAFRCAYDSTVANGVRGFAVDSRPAVEVFAIK